MIEILTKVRAKITIIVLENREPYCFIIIFKYKQVSFPYFLIRCWFQLLSTYEQSSYYCKVYGPHEKTKNRYRKISIDPSQNHGIFTRSEIDIKNIPIDSP